MISSDSSSAGGLRALVFSVIVVAVSCDRGGAIPTEPSVGGDFGDASFADVVVDPAHRPAWRALPPPTDERDPFEALTGGPPVDADVDDDADAAPRMPEIGEVEVLLGAAGDRSVLEDDAIDRFDGGFEGSWVRPGESVPARLHVVLDAPYQSWTDEGTFVHLVVLTPDFHPAAGAEVYLFGRRIGTADPHGAFSFRRQPTPGGMDTGQGLLVVRHGGLTRRVRYDAGARTASFESVTIYGYTDRGVYEPGDTALFRAIAWRLRGEYVPYAQHPLEVQLANDHEEIVAGASVTTDDWGIAEHALPIPATLPDGPYSLRVVSGEEVAESRLVVQRFVPPVIAMEHDLPRYLARTREELTTNVSLSRFAGGEIGRVHLSLVAKDDETELERVDRDVSGPGPHALTFDAASLARVLYVVDGSGPGRRTLGLDLVARDESGRTDTIHRFVDVVPNPYSVAVELDRTRYQVGDPVNVMVRATERDGVPVRERDVVLRIAGGPRLTARSDADGVARFTFPMLSHAASLQAFLDDVREPVGWATLPSPVVIPMLSAVPSTVVTSGDEIDVRILFPNDVRPVEGIVHADVVDSSGAIIHSSLVPIVETGGRPEARSRVVAPGGGSVLLTLWCVARRGDVVGVVTDGQSLVVTPGETLTVTLGGLPEHASPGQEIDATIEVRDAEGALHDAVLGVSVADRAVLSLLDPFERAPVDRFYNAERKVLASTGAQTLTWPWVSRTWGADRVDIGWPGTFGFHAGRDRAPRVVNATEVDTFDALPIEMGALGALFGDQIGASFGFGGMGLVGYGMGGGGTGEGTIGLGNLGTIGAGTGAAPAAEPTTIVLRTEHDETSLWLPRLVAENGRATVHARLPESLTEEEVSVLATDRTGGIALARVRVPITQALFARSDLPPSMIEGEQLEVTVAVENHGGESVEAELALEALTSSGAAPGALAIEGEPRRVSVRPGGTATARFMVRAGRPGIARYRVRAVGAGIEDVDERTLHVAPLGEPIVETSVAVVSPSGSHRTTLTIDASDRFRQIRLGVVFPTVAPALGAVDRLLDLAPWGPDPASSEILGAAAAYRYLVLTDRFDPARHGPMVDRLRSLGRELSRAQLPDGSFGWYWSHDAGTPFITVHALEAMLELRECALFTDEAAIRAAALHLLGVLRSPAGMTAAEIAPWEGHDPWVSLAASAEALHAIARALPPDDRSMPELREALLARLPGVLDAPSPDPLALAHIVSAALWVGVMDRGQLEAVVPRLTEVRDVVHWEPGWFDAWGGNVEAAASTLEVLDVIRRDDGPSREITRGLVSDARFEAAARDAIRFILHTRGSFGAWHNTRATAWAIRALTRIAPGDPDERGTVRVLVDGEERAATALSAATLFAGALALREIDLSSLAPGVHEIEVRYDGRSRPRVELETRRWTGGTRPVTPETPRLSRAIPERCAVGSACEIVVTLPAELRFPALVSQPLGDGMEIDRDALAALRAAGTVAWDELSSTGTLRLGLSTRLPALALPMRPRRAGSLPLPPTRAEEMAGGPVWASDPATLIAH